MSQPAETGAPADLGRVQTEELPAAPPTLSADATDASHAGTPEPPGTTTTAVPAGHTVAVEPQLAFAAPLPVTAAQVDYPPPPPPVTGPTPLPGGATPPAAGTGMAQPSVAPPSRRRVSFGPRARAALTGVILVALSLLLAVLGLSYGFGGESLWSRTPLWSLLAIVAVVLGLLAFVPDAPGRSRLRPHSGWKIAAGGLVGFVVFWLVVVLRMAATDRGFVLTAALAALAAAVWIAPSREG